MHALHAILVNIEKSKTYNDIEDVRNYAETKTENFYDTVFDWRETDTAGRWVHEYPTNVIFASDDLERFIEEIERCRKNQDTTIRLYLNNIESLKAIDLSKSLKEIILNMINTPNKKNSHASWLMMQIAKLLYGKYDFESMFYDTEDYTSKITKDTIEKIMKNPEDYALVFFDYHY